MKNYLTFKQLDYQVLKKLGMAANDIPISARQAYRNNALMKLFGLLDGVNDPYYNFTAVLSVAADQERLWDFVHNAGVITAINATANTITRSTGSFQAGSILAVTLTDTGSAARYSWIARVTVAGAVATYEVISGADSSLTPDLEASVIVIKSLSDATVDLSGMYVKAIRRVWDGADGAERMFFLLTDGRRYADAQNDPDYETSVVAYHRGDTLDLKVCPLASALGVVQMEYRGKPNICTDATEGNEILLPPEYNEMLTDEVMAAYSVHAGRPIGQDLAGRLENYRKMYEASSAAEAKEAKAKNPGSK